MVLCPHAHRAWCVSPPGAALVAKCSSFTSSLSSKELKVVHETAVCSSSLRPPNLIRVGLSPTLQVGNLSHEVMTQVPQGSSSEARLLSPASLCNLPSFCNISDPHFPLIIIFKEKHTLIHHHKGEVPASNLSLLPF